MGAPAIELLVSCVNGGGVFHLSRTGVSQWSKVDTTGLALIPGGCLLARQAEGRAEVRRWLEGEVHRIELTKRSLDLHDLRWHGGRLLVVATQINTIFEFDSAFRELRHWVLQGEEDSCHVNSVCIHDGRILASRFGNFLKHRGYSGHSREAGEVYDVETGEVLLRNLSQPHSLVSHEGSLWLCDSETHRVLEFRDWKLQRALEVDGYARGLALADGFAFIGLSRSRNADSGSRESAAVLRVKLATGAEVERTALPVNEVYDIRVMDHAGIPSLRDAAFRDAVNEFDTQRHERNLAVEAVRQQARDALSMGAELPVLHRKIHELHLQLEEESSQRMLAQQAARTLEGIRLEDQEWIARLEGAVQSGRSGAEQSVAAVNAVLGNYQEAVTSRDVYIEMLEQRSRNALVLARDAAAAAADHAALAIAVRDQRLQDLRDHIARIESSRSWRWTRPLRKDAPHLPAETNLPEAGTAAAGMAEVEFFSTLPQYASVAGGETGATLVTPPKVPSRASLPVVGLSFPEVDEPEVTIVVAAHGNFAMTRSCLAAVRADSHTPTYEVILVEDASGDTEMERFASVPGLRYVRNAENVGYLRSMNAILPLARGQYTVLLNNDTQPHEGWLRELLQPFRLFHDCGAVGSRLLFPDGRQQESGSIVWNDGSACNHGIGVAGWRVEDHAVREVDYVSAAAMIIRTDLMDELEGFDPRYMPAYYEDTDLAFRLRARGYRCFYQPYSEVTHVQGASHGTDESTGVKRHQVINLEAFRNRWRETLEIDQLPPGQHPFLARCRAQRKQSVLIIGQEPPRPELSAGSRAIWQLVQQLQHTGFDVRFWSQVPVEDVLGSDLLARHGIELFDQQRVGRAFEEWFAQHAAYFDIVILSGVATATACLSALRRHSTATVIYYGHDIHRIRLERQAAVLGDQEVMVAAERMGVLEEVAWLESNVVLYPTDEETRVVQAFLLSRGLSEDRARTVPLLVFPEDDPRPDADRSPSQDRRDVLFVGGFAHTPNVDGIEWFAREVWPVVRKGSEFLRLVVIGDAPPAHIRSLASADVLIVGGVDEATLRARYDTARVAIAPLRFGAGLKGKIVESMYHGVPCVTTPVGAEGIGIAAKLAVARDPDDFAAAVLQLVDDDIDWRAASDAGRAYVQERFSRKAATAFWHELLGPPGLASVAERLERLRHPR